MKAHSIVLVGLVLASAFQVQNATAKTADEISASGSADDKGVAIAGELASRNSGFKDLGGEVEMVLRDADGSESKRKFTLKVLEKPSASAGDYSLITFDSPADVKGTAVLSHAGASDEDEQWLFLPSAKRVKRIASANRASSFVGSEFTFEDLTAGEGKKYAWKLASAEACGALSCFSLEATPKDASSAYSKRVLHVDTTEFRIQSTDFYDRKGAKLKTLTYGNYQKMGGKYWRSHSWTMKNHQSGKSTVIAFTSMKLANGYSANDFAPGKLGN
jgi:outer membrane lipoprotein-sorting protein